MKYVKRRAGQWALLAFVVLLTNWSGPALGADCRGWHSCYAKGLKAHVRDEFSSAHDYFAQAARAKSGGSGESFDSSGDGIGDFAYVPEVLAVHSWVQSGRPCGKEQQRLWEAAVRNGYRQVKLPLNLRAEDFDATGSRCEVQDRDSDGVDDDSDNCPDVANPDQANSDGRGAGDACELPAVLGIRSRDAGQDARRLGASSWVFSELQPGSRVLDLSVNLPLERAPASGCWERSNAREWTCEIEVESGRDRDLELELVTTWGQSDRVRVRIPGAREASPRELEWELMLQHARRVTALKQGP